jgi:hypothetical protein
MVLPVTTNIYYIFFLRSVNVHILHEPYLSDFTVGNGESFTLLYVDDVRTSQETNLWTITGCYGDSFTLTYADYVRTSQETHLSVSTVCYGYNFKEWCLLGCYAVWLL